MTWYPDWLVNAARENNTLEKRLERARILLSSEQTCNEIEERAKKSGLRKEQKNNEPAVNTKGAPPKKIVSLTDACNRYGYAQSGSQEEEDAFDEYISLCDDSNKLQSLFNGTNVHSHRMRTFSKWLTMCKTPDEARSAHDSAGDNDTDFKNLAVSRHRELGGTEL